MKKLLGLSGILFFALIVLFDFTITSCATVGSPSGGPRDTLAPALDTSFPANLTTNFKGNQVRLLFNEYLTLKSPNKQITISPPIPGDLDIELIKSRQILISWEDTLQENTTYTISFGNAVTDFTEGNVNDKLKYVFSTGDFIDSLSLQGRVINTKGEAVEGILVALYDYERVGDTDSIPYKELPSYYAFTGETGRFEMDYLKYGKYHVLTFEDAQGNFQMRGNEKMGFLNDTLVLDTTTQPILLQIFEPAPTRRMLNPRHVSFGKVQFPFSYKLQDFDLDILHPQDTLPHVLTFSPQRDTAFFWFNRPELDSLALVVQANDRPADTVSMNLRSYTAGDLKLSAANPEVKFNERAMLRATQPISAMNASLARIFAKDTTAPDTFYLPTPLRTAFDPPARSTQFGLQLLPGAATSFFGQSLTDTTRLNFSVLQKEDLGSLLFTVIGDTDQAYVLVIRNPKGNEIKRETFVGEEVVNLRHYRPGIYQIELIVDDNGDGEWTTGNYLQRRQPERIIPYTDNAEIRANWELELDWIVQGHKPADAATPPEGSPRPGSLKPGQDNSKKSRSDKN